MLAEITFIFSLSLFIAFNTLLYWEDKTNHTYFPFYRQKLDEYTIKLVRKLLLLRKVFDSLGAVCFMRRSFYSFVAYILKKTAVLTAWISKKSMRGAKRIDSKSASTFLQEVTKHKNTNQGKIEE